MRSKKNNNKKAVSAVIGVILMVLITVAIAATVYVYVSGMIEKYGYDDKPCFQDLGEGDYTYCTYKEGNITGTIYWAGDGTISLEKCNNKRYSVPELANEDLIGHTITLFINQTFEKVHFVHYNWVDNSEVFVSERVSSYKLGEINGNYKNEYFEMQQFKEYMTKIVSQNVSADLSGAIDEHGAGIYTVYNTKISFTNPSNVSTTFSNGNFTGKVYLRARDCPIYGDKFAIFLNDTELYKITTEEERTWHNDNYYGGYGYYTYDKVTKPRGISFSLDLPPGASQTFDLKIVQYGTGPGVYKPGLYIIPIDFIRETAGSTTNIGNTTLFIQLG